MKRRKKRERERKREETVNGGKQLHGKYASGAILVLVVFDVSAMLYKL